jgi:dihydroorotase
MQEDYLFKGVQAINEGKIVTTDMLVRRGRIERVDPSFDVTYRVSEVRGDGLYLMPGAIDDQVHFREPGLTHKADIYTESRAAVAGGVTTYMEMPNTKPGALTASLLADKYAIAAQRSLANYSFYMGVSNENYADVMAVVKQQTEQQERDICGVKVFMGSSTGNMLVDSPEVLENLFANCSMLIATHCEDEATITHQLAEYTARYGDKLDASYHPLIRDEQACYLSSSMAVALARKHGTRLHVLHISTAKELTLLTNQTPLADKRITAEACVHHLWFDAGDYGRLGNLIKCNPAIKDSPNKIAILAAVLDGKIDVIATDHAPHTATEKAAPYLQAPAGLPLVQHSINMMLDMYHQGLISLEMLVQKMCHDPAVCFGVVDRGYLREGYWADLVLLDLHKRWEVTPTSLRYKCGWSPLMGHIFTGQICQTYINGYLAYDAGTIHEQQMGQRIKFT